MDGGHLSLAMMSPICPEGAANGSSYNRFKRRKSRRWSDTAMMSTASDSLKSIFVLDVLQENAFSPSC